MSLKRSRPLQRRSGLKRSTRLAAQSSKRKADASIYRVLRQTFLAEHPYCQIQALGCLLASRDVHHTAGRGKNLNAVETWMAVCRSCHDWVHSTPSVARAKGWLK